MAAEAIPHTTSDLELFAVEILSFSQRIKSKEGLT